MNHMMMRNEEGDDDELDNYVMQSKENDPEKAESNRGDSEAY